MPATLTAMRSLDPTKVVIGLAMFVVLGVPFLFRPDKLTGDEADRRVIIVTPHNEQIRREFGAAFSEWHEREYGETAAVVWVNPGGTSEIRRQLQAVYSKAIKEGRILPDGRMAEGSRPMPQDLFFGGGSYEHGQMKRGVTVAFTPRDADAVGISIHAGAIPDDGELSIAHDEAAGIARLSKDAEAFELNMSISVPVGSWDEARLARVFGDNFIGPESNHLYDPDRFWIGTALSGFGVVYNRDVLGELGVEEPDSWWDFGSPELRGWVALADPRQSGSVATTYDSILNTYGWDDGWRILREMCANARYFSNSSPKVPLDVSQGQAAIGVAIDFYGRYQAQAVMQEGETPETSRVGYVDPPGATFIDPDPISLLRGGPDPETAQRFIDFVLTDEGQALWQFVTKADGAPATDPADADTWGPERFELRRMPVRRDFIRAHLGRFVDEVDPFEIAAPTASRGWRSSVAPMMSTFGIDTHRFMVEAWDALSAARAAHESGAFPTAILEEMEGLFYEMPTHTFPDGREVLFTPESYREIRNAWRDPREWRKAKIAYTLFFTEQYRAVVALWDEHKSAQKNEA